MKTQELVASIVKAKADKLSFDRWVVRTCTQIGKTAPVVEKMYTQLLTDIRQLPLVQRVHFWRKVRFPKVNASNVRLFEMLDFDMNDNDSGKVVGQ